MANYVSLVPGIWIEDYSTKVGVGEPNPGLGTGFKWVYLGVPDNTAATHAANQAIDIITLPALAAGAQGTVTWTNSLINAHSIIAPRGVRVGTTTPAAGAICLVTHWDAPGAGSVVLHLFNPGSAATLSTDFQAVLEVLQTVAG